MRILLSLWLILGLSLTLFSQHVSNGEVLMIKDNFEKAYKITSKTISEKPLVYKKDTIAFIFNYNNAFIVISNDKQLPPIKAYSLENSFPIADKKSELNFEDIIIDDLSNFILLNSNNSKNNSYKQQNIQQWKNIKTNGISKDTKGEYGPFLGNIYGQVNCKNDLGNIVNVTNYYTPSNYAVGCVALTFAEVLQFHNWPRRGVGSHSYSDNDGSSNGTYSADFDEKYYNWALIKDEYHNKSTTSKERSELGKLAFHCAVAVNMDFEYNGSTSNINRIPQAANKHFRFTSTYLTKSSSQFWSKVDDNLVKSLPVQFAIYTTAGAGHAVVCDGIKTSSDLYHLNMGWWGSSNAWYTIQGSFNAGGYTNITAGVMDFIPVVELGEPKLDIDNESVDLEWFYPTSVFPNAYQLQVKIGADNWTDVEDNLVGNTYSYKYDDTNIHNFRLRAKCYGNWIDNSWSEYMDINIQSEIDNQITEELSVYPTILQNELTVESKYVSGSIIELIDVLGNIVYQNNVSSGYGSSKIVFDVSYLNQGMYILRLQNGDIVQISRVIKYN
ncbi:MAG: C10 family peptidase [Bacteroidales bacterium]|nr:C10 family peptidase [Bacteroidales bacterium]